jgi:serine protease Do
VKPAVISVRVKVPAAEEPALLQQNRDDDEQIPVHPRSPLDKFLQQLGDQFGQQFGRQFGAPRGHETITGEGSGFFNLGGRLCSD